MNIQELFYGAWVYLLKNVGGQIVKEAHRVTGIMTSDKDTYIQTDDSDTYLPITAYEPIPITPEIMKANKFIIDLGSATKQIFGCNWIEYKFKESQLVIWENSNAGEITLLCTCNYLHELQVAFHLCGYEEEIKL